MHAVKRPWFIDLSSKCFWVFDMGCGLCYIPGQQSWTCKAGCIFYVQAQHSEIDADVLDPLPSRYSQHC